MRHMSFLKWLCTREIYVGPSPQSLILILPQGECQEATFCKQVDPTLHLKRSGDVGAQPPFFCPLFVTFAPLLGTIAISSICTEYLECLWPLVLQKIAWSPMFAPKFTWKWPKNDQKWPSITQPLCRFSLNFVSLTCCMCLDGRGILNQGRRCSGSRDSDVLYHCPLLSQNMPEPTYLETC